MVREGDKCGLPNAIQKNLVFLMGKIKGSDDWWEPITTWGSGGGMNVNVLNNVSIYNKLTRPDVRKISVDEGLPTESWLTPAEIDSLFDDDFLTGVLKEGAWKIYFMHPLRFWHSWVYVNDTVTHVESTIIPTDGVKTDIVDSLSFAVPADKTVVELYVEKIPDTNSDTCDGAGKPITSQVFGIPSYVYNDTLVGLAVDASIYGFDPFDLVNRFHLNVLQSDRNIIPHKDRSSFYALMAASKLLAKSEDCFYITPEDLRLLTMTYKEQKEALDVHTIEANTYTHTFTPFDHETNLFYPPNDQYAIVVEGSELVIHNDSDANPLSVTVFFPASLKDIKYATTGKALATLGGRVTSCTPFSKETIVGCGGEPVAMRYAGSTMNTVFVKINYRFVRKDPCPTPTEFVGFTERPSVSEHLGFTEKPSNAEFTAFTERPTHSDEYVGFTEKPAHSIEYVGFTERPAHGGEYVGFTERPFYSERFIGYGEKPTTIMSRYMGYGEKPTSIVQRIGFGEKPMSIIPPYLWYTEDEYNPT